VSLKYDYSYEELGKLFQKFIPAWQIEIEKYFSLVVFNYLFSNGNAHLKNFSLIETENNNYVLSPAYSLKNTMLHIGGPDFALRKGLFADDYMSDDFKKTGHASYLDFTEFGKRIGVSGKKINILLEPFRESNSNVEAMAQRSFLSKILKEKYIRLYFEKLNYLNGK
jgi:serine/threonine-protein kinase HipA